MAKKSKVRTVARDIKVENDDVGSIERRSIFGICPKYVVFAVLAVLCLIIYGQTLGFDFINIDDNQYVYENSFVSTGVNAANIIWAFTAFHSSNWHPLTWISHQLDSSLFGLNAGYHHLINVGFHIANSILLFALIRKLTDSFWKAAVVAAIFAVHPAHVESVAWVAERKDVLSTLFWLLTTIFYIRFARNLSDSRAYWISLLLFALGLMAKPMLVTLPFVLVLLDYWPLKRFEKWNVSSLVPIFKEKLPFFALSAISAIVTILAQGSSGAIQTIERIPFFERLINAIVSYAKYVIMLFYPVNLGVWYPYQNNFTVLQIAAAAILVIGVSAISVWQLKERKYLFVGWFWFLGTLVPVIGILQVGRQSLADRYTYVPYIGLLIAFVWLAAELFEKLQLNKAVTASICALCISILTGLAFIQVTYWKNTETISRHTLSVTENNYFIEHNFCNYLEGKNRLDEAVVLCKAAIEHDPMLAEGYNTLGTIQLKQNRVAEAAANFRKSIDLQPAYVMAYANLAIAEIREGNFEQAGTVLNQGIENDKYEFFDTKRKLDAYSTLAVEALKNKKYPVAEEFLRKSLDITPNDVDVQRNLAIALYSQNKTAEAVTILNGAIQQNPKMPELYNSLGLIYAGQNRNQEAAVLFQKALQIDPGFQPAKNNLAKLMQ